MDVHHRPETLNISSDNLNSPKPVLWAVLIQHMGLSNRGLFEDATDAYGMRAVGGFARMKGRCLRSAV